jgi:hypothetical protein
VRDFRLRQTGNTTQRKSAILGGHLQLQDNGMIGTIGSIRTAMTTIQRRIINFAECDTSDRQTCRRLTTATRRTPIIPE